MKVKKRDSNVYRIRLEHEDDLYHLNLLLDEGDMVRALTERREAAQSDRIRSERTKKKKMKLTIEVKNVEYQSFGQRLRCHGVIAVGERDQSSHHTLILEPGDDFDIGKTNWLPHQKKRLREAAQPTVTAIAIAVESNFFLRKWCANVVSDKKVMEKVVSSKKIYGTNSLGVHTTCRG